MSNGNYKKITIIAVIATLLAGTHVLGDIGEDLGNGDFSSPLTVGWTDFDVATIDAGVAVLGEDSFDVAFLEQRFTIPMLAVSLSFEYKPLFEADGEEAFIASLLDPSSYDPLVPTDADPFDSSETFYFMHDWDEYWGVDDVLTDPAYVTLTDLGDGWTRVTLDLASLGGTATDALLGFDFIPGFYDSSLDGEIRIDNVSVAVVPTPTAVVMGLLGLGSSFGLIRRKRKQVQS